MQLNIPFHTWPEIMSGKIIVSQTQPGTNNELVACECCDPEMADMICKYLNRVRITRKIQTRKAKGKSCN